MRELHCACGSPCPLRRCPSILGQVFVGLPHKVQLLACGQRLPRRSFAFARHRLEIINVSIVGVRIECHRTCRCNKVLCRADISCHVSDSPTAIPWPGNDILSHSIDECSPPSTTVWSNSRYGLHRFVNINSIGVQGYGLIKSLELGINNDGVMLDNELFGASSTRSVRTSTGPEDNQHIRLHSHRSLMNPSDKGRVSIGPVDTRWSIPRLCSWVGVEEKWFLGFWTRWRRESSSQGLLCHWWSRWKDRSPLDIEQQRSMGEAHLQQDHVSLKHHLPSVVEH